MAEDMTAVVEAVMAVITEVVVVGMVMLMAMLIVIVSGSGNGLSGRDSSN